MLLTPEGYEALKGELETLRTDRRREIAERIRTAREFGDIAENAEYDDAKNEQAMLEHKIAQLEDRLYGWGEELESNAISVYVHQLRRKLGEGFIHTVRGVGYYVGAPKAG